MVELSVEDYFKLGVFSTLDLFNNGNFIFSKFWYSPFFPYKYKLLPGSKEDLSGSVIGGYNLGINRYINETKRKAAITAFEFLTSKEMQKRIVIEHKTFSGIPSIYDDKEVCSVIDCEIFREAQLIIRPMNKLKNYNKYSERFRNNVYDFLYGNKTASEVLKNIDDITRIYYISLNPKESFLGLFIIIITFISSVIMLLSLLFLRIENYKEKLNFLSNDFWVLSVLGACIMMSALYTEIGEIKVIKCHFKPILLCIGYTLNLIPILHKLIINFPEKNIISRWISKHRYIFISIFLIMDIVGDCLYFVSPYNIKEDNVIHGKIFHICKMNNSFGQVLVYCMLLFRVLIFFTVIFLVFIEWNIDETKKDVKFLLSAITVDLLCYAIIFALKYSKIKQNNYIAYYVIYSIIVIIFSISNYVFLYAIKIIRSYLNENSEEEQLLKRIKNQFKNTFHTQIKSNQQENGCVSDYSTSKESRDSKYSKDSERSSMDSYRKSKGKMSSSYTYHNISQKLLSYHNQHSLDSITNRNSVI
ncbi:hypothetical protein U3516DRAFT_840618 [Neocallimastix sp. 'constans']